MATDDEARERELEADIRQDHRELAVAEAVEERAEERVEQIEERVEALEAELRRLRHEGRYHLEIIVNGTPAAVAGSDDAPLETFIVAALDKTDNIGQPPDKWTLKDEAQAPLDRTRSPESYGFPSGTRLFLSLDAGVGGVRGAEQFVDPAVSKAKFEAEVAEYRALEAAYRLRGWILLRAEFPTAVVGLAAAHLRPAPFVTAVSLDYTNYDAVPPSVRLVNPFTEEPYAFKDLPTMLFQFRPEFVAAAAAAGQIPYARLMQGDTPESIPFLCIPGVREYHQHPAHSGDAWELHRAAGAGKMCRIVEIIYELGVKPIAYGISLITQVQMMAPTAA
jgi:hypothetical protein